MRSGQYQRKAAPGSAVGGMAAAPMDANTQAALRNAEVLFETRSVAEIRQVPSFPNPHQLLRWPHARSCSIYPSSVTVIHPCTCIRCRRQGIMPNPAFPPLCVSSRLKGWRRFSNQLIRLGL
jgi:hypothetical protein